MNGEDSYDRYICGLSQFCMVDVAATARWIARLAAEPQLRHTLGDAAKRAARSNFDWAVVLLRYRELWAEQSIAFGARAAAEILSGRRHGDTAIPPSALPRSLRIVWRRSR